MNAELYDPVGDTWSAAGTIFREGIHLWYATAAALPDGRVMLAGGGDPTDWVLDGIYLYDSATNSWNPGGRLETVREGQSATSLPNGGVLVAGGVPQLGRRLQQRTSRP
jgi:hypothetical protein